MIIDSLDMNIADHVAKLDVKASNFESGGVAFVPLEAMDGRRPAAVSVWP